MLFFWPRPPCSLHLILETTRQTCKKIVVEGVNVVKKHSRPTQDNPQGGIIEKEAAIHISNVMLVVGGKATRVGYKSLDDGRKVKFAKTTGEVIN